MVQVKHSLIAATLAAACSSAGMASAADIKLSGFLNAIGSTHDAKNMEYNESIDDVWGFSSTNLGINLASHIDENITVAAQLFGSKGDTVTVDWAFATYKIDDSSSIKFGKIKYAGNLYSETTDVGFLYPWVRAPESIYSESSELFLESYEGGAYKFTGGDDTEFAVEVYYGATDSEGEGSDINRRDNMYGLVVSTENETGKVQISYNSALHTKVTGIGSATPLSTNTRIDLLALGAEANFDSLQLITEVTQAKHAASPTTDKLGWFVTAAYTLGDWKPHLTFQDFSVDDASQEQSGITLGLNRRLGNSAVLKFEVQQVSDIIGNGFFEDPIFEGTANETEIADGDDVLIYNIALNIVF